MKKFLMVAAAAFALSTLMAGATVLAHHAFASEYDAKKPVTVKGTITKMQWINPHAWLHIDVKAPDGSVQSWALEFGGPSGLMKRGWRKTDLPVGAEVTVKGYLAKNGTNTINADTVTMGDGRSLFAGSSGTGAPNDQ
jgi:hypothetical protein